MNTRISFGKALSILFAAAALGACGETNDFVPPDGGGTHKPDMAKPSNNDGSTDPDLANADLAEPNSDITTLNIHYPKGTHSLSVRGDKAGLNWDSGQAATAQGSDLFTITLTIPAGETLEWKPLLDDKDWSHGPNYKAKRGDTLDIYPHFYTSAGRLDKPNDLKAFKGDNLSARDVWVYLPPSYDENSTAKYPVLYMHDATNLFDASTSFGGVEWKVDETLDGAIEGNGSIQEIIVVALFATADRIPDYTPTADSGYGGGNGDAYLKMIVEKLKPVIDGKYRTLTDRANTGMMGSSLGGLISTYAGVKYPEVFGLIGAMSPSTWWDDTYIIGAVGGIDMTKAHPLRVYMDSGNPDDGYADTKNLAAKWKSLGYQDGKDFEYVVQDGAQHNEGYWQQRLPGALQFLFGPRPAL